MHRRLAWSLHAFILRAPDGNAPPAPAPAPAPSPAPAPAPAPSPAPAPAPAPGAPYRPEGLPDHLYGTSEKETIDKLYGAVNGFRTQQAEKGEVPADFKGYAFKAADAVAPFLKTEADNKVLGVIGDMAVKAGITTKQFTPFVNSVLETLAQGGMIEDPFDPKAEAAALLPDIKDEAERFREVDRRVRDNAAWIDVQKGRGLDDKSALALQALLDRADGIKAVEFFRAQLRETTPALGGSPGGAMTAADLKARNADPRNNPGDRRYEPAFAAETTRLYRQVHGDAPRS